jgi:hypothetical protein
MTKRMDKRIIVAGIGIVGVNLTAVIAQFQFMREHLPTWGIAGQLLFAGSLESIAIMISYFAHLALVSGDSATRLRLASYIFAIGIGLMNASHYVSHGHITFESIAVGVCSASSPWLWGIYSRRQSRDILLANNLIEGHAVRLGINRWMFHSVKSFRVFRMATWVGVQNPADAIALLPEPPEPIEAESVPESDDASIPVIETATEFKNTATAVRAALDALGNDTKASSAVAWLHERGIDTTEAYVRVVRSTRAKRIAASPTATVRSITDGKKT